MIVRINSRELYKNLQQNIAGEPTIEELRRYNKENETMKNVMAKRLMEYMQNQDMNRISIDEFLTWHSAYGNYYDYTITGHVREIKGYRWIGPYDVYIRDAGNKQSLKDALMDIIKKHGHNPADPENTPDGAGLWLRIEFDDGITLLIEDESVYGDAELYSAAIAHIGD